MRYDLTGQRLLSLKLHGFIVVQGKADCKKQITLIIRDEPATEGGKKHPSKCNFFDLCFGTVSEFGRGVVYLELRCVDLEF
jgi:hypothetical protein